MYYVLYAKLLYITLLPGLTLAPCNKQVIEENGYL